MAQSFIEPCSRGVIRAQPCPRELKREIPLSRRRLVLAACVLASSMVFIDGSVLTVALPRLRTDFGAEFAVVQWILNGYLLALASLTLIGGALADIHGRARMLAGGCILFGLASVACALAPSASWLIAARVVQGIAAAVVAPASLALIGATYPREERNSAVGVWAAASALTTAGGPVLGGWMTETLGWPSIFWINPPIAAAAVALLWLFAPADLREPRRLDLFGAVILATALGALAWALGEIGSDVSGATDGAPPPSTTAIVLVTISGVAGLAGFAMWERASDHPMIPPRLARNRPFFGLNLATLFIYAGLSIMFFLLPFDLVDRRLLSSADVGLAFLPFTLAVGFLSQTFGGVADRIGARVMLIGGAIGASAAYAWLAVGSGMSFIFGVIVPMALLGLSFAVLITPLTASVMSSVGSSDEGLASGVNNAASRIAQLVGVALGAGVGAFASGYPAGLGIASAATFIGAVVIARTVPNTGNRPNGSRPAT